MWSCTFGEAFKYEKGKLIFQGYHKNKQVITYQYKSKACGIVKQSGDWADSSPRQKQRVIIS